MADFVKDPDESLFYQMDWTAWLPTGETVSTSTWAVTGPDALLTQDNASVLTGNLKTQVRLAAGSVDRDYVVTNRITTSGTPSQTAERSFTLAIRAR